MYNHAITSSGKVKKLRISKIYYDANTGEQSIFGKIHTDHVLGCHKELGNRQIHTHTHTDMHTHRMTRLYHKISYHM